MMASARGTSGAPSCPHLQTHLSWDILRWAEMWAKKRPLRCGGCSLMVAPLVRAALLLWLQWLCSVTFLGPCRKTQSRSIPMPGQAAQGCSRCAHVGQHADAQTQAPAVRVGRLLSLQLHTMLLGVVQGQHHAAATLWTQRVSGLPLAIVLYALQRRCHGLPGCAVQDHHYAASRPCSCPPQFISCRMLLSSLCLSCCWRLIDTGLLTVSRMRSASSAASEKCPCAWLCMLAV